MAYTTDSPAEGAVSLGARSSIAGHVEGLVKGAGVIDVFVTPDIAREILDKYNTSNRGYSPHTARRYASDMASGKWFQNQQNQWMGFYEDGSLADGQHRLGAISSSGIPMTMRFERGIKKEAAFGIDAHRARRVSDQIKLSQASDWVGRDEISLAKFEAKATRGFSVVSPQSIVSWCEAHKDNLMFVSTAMPGKVRSLTTTSIRYAIFAASYHEDKERLREFCTSLTSGITRSMDDVAAIRLRERITKESTHLNKGGEGRLEASKMTMRAIRAYCERVHLGRLYAPQFFIYTPPKIGFPEDK